MTKEHRLRAVLDTNVVVAALRSRNPSSPNAELLRRWQTGEFELVYSAALRAEYEEQCLAQELDPQRVALFMEQLTARGILIEVTEVEAIISADADDDIPLACALAGETDCLVTYDGHLLSLGNEYHGIQLLKALPFLYLVRGDTLPA